MLRPRTPVVNVTGRMVVTSSALMMTGAGRERLPHSWSAPPRVDSPHTVRDHYYPIAPAAGPYRPRQAPHGLDAHDARRHGAAEHGARSSTTPAAHHRRRPMKLQRSPPFTGMTPPRGRTHHKHPDCDNARQGILILVK